jgi:predicted esterase
MAGATQDNNTWGYSPENLARNRACQAVLATRSDVNVSRLAIWGHSRGAFAAIGIASDFGQDLKALGCSAGGIHETADLSEPNAAEASHITAPTILFHGSTDTIVPPADSARLQTLLNSLGVTNTRVFYDTTGITPSTNAHNIHQVSTFNADMLMQWRAWLTTHGVLP